jgi:hypothetical protein
VVKLAKSEPQAAVVVSGTTTRLDETALAAEISKRLGGLRTTSTEPSGGIVWTDRGDEVLLHLNSLRTTLTDRMVYVSLDLETDQTGRTPLVCAFALGNADDPAGLIAVTDELPRGNGLLASRWGESLQIAIWSALLGIVSDFAKQSNLTPAGFAASSGSFILRADT